MNEMKTRYRLIYRGTRGGMFYCVAEIGGFTGPLIMGALVDITGGFLAGVLFFAVLCLAFAVLTLYLKTSPAMERQETHEGVK